MRSFNIIILSAFFMLSSHAEARRLAERTIDASKVDQIFMGPGLATSLELPENVSEVITGAPQIFKASISSVNPNEVILSLSNMKPFKTNLIVRTVKRTVVFDLVPSLSKHQDLIIVTSTFGKPLDQNKMSLREKRLRFERGEDVVPPTAEDF